MVIDWGRAALGFLELGIGRAEAAIAELEQAAGLGRGIRPGGSDLRALGARPGGGLPQGRPCARTPSGPPPRSLAGRKRAGVPLPLAFAARCRGLVEEDGFEADFDEALAQHDRADAPFEAARTLLAYGSRLHRARRRVEGRKRLRAALEIFERLGARPWIERTNAELGAAGAVRRAPIADPDELSAQEVRVAMAVAERRDEQAGGGGAVPEPEDDRVPPWSRLSQARHPFPHGARHAGRKGELGERAPQEQEPGPSTA